jgi:hypothetical protein
MSDEDARFLSTRFGLFAIREEERDAILEAINNEDGPAFEKAIEDAYNERAAVVNHIRKHYSDG